MATCFMFDLKISYVAINHSVNKGRCCYSRLWRMKLFPIHKSALSIYLFFRYLQYMRHGKQHFLNCALYTKQIDTHTRIQRIMSSFHISDIMHFNAFCVFCAVLLISLWHFLSLSTCIELKKLLKCYCNYSGS